jgi:hypothetical protein
MAGASLLTLLDDIASVLDDVALLTKVATKRTAGVIGDDLAVNAYQIGGVSADRELPVIWAVARGSVRNKLLLVPSALALNAFLPWALTPLLLCGGAYLCFEAFEKLAVGGKRDRRSLLTQSGSGAANPLMAPGISESDKIAAAVRTDLVLSAEIIVISLGTVVTTALPVQAAVLSAVALLMTVGVYGLVAGIVKLDDAGIYLARRSGVHPLMQLQRTLGRALLRFAPLLMKSLSVIGTAAMFLVGGGIVLHSSEPLAGTLGAWGIALGDVPVIGSWLAGAFSVLLPAAFGLLIGAVSSGMTRWLRTLLPESLHGAR